MAKEKRAAWFKLFLHQRPIMEAASNEVVGAAVKAAMRYFDTGEVTNLSPMEAMLFASLKEYADEATEDYIRKTENGKKGGRPKKPEVLSSNVSPAMQTEADAEADAEAEAETESEADAEADTEREKEAEGELEAVIHPSGTAPRSHFSPPGTEEVRQYCLENGYNLDPERFIDYYTANGWCMGNTSMKDWKAAVRNWNRKEKPNAPTKPKPTWTFGVHL